MALPQSQVEQFKIVQNPSKPQEQKEATFEDRLKSEARKYEDLTKNTRTRRYFIHALADLYSKGLHYVSYNSAKAQFEEWDQATIKKCMLTPTPLLQRAVEVIASQYTSSNARPIAVAPAKDVKTKAVVRAVQDHAEYLDWEFFRADPDQRQTEAKLIPLRGVFNELVVDYSQGPEIELPQYEQTSKMVCDDCGEDGEASELGEQDGNLAMGGDSSGGISTGGASGGPVSPSGDLSGGGPGTESVACPHCGSQNLTQQTGIINKGNVKRHQGKVCRRIFDPFQVEVYDRRRDIEESPYLIADEICFKSEILKQYPWLKAVEGQACLGTWHDGYTGLHYLYQIETLIANTGKLDQSKPDYQNSFAGAYLNEMLVWKRRVFIDVDAYRDWKFEKAAVLPGTNKMIPAGTWVADVFPEGRCTHIINGGPVVKVENVDKNTRWSMCKYRVPSTGLHGGGMASVVSQNRGYDEATSFGMQAMLMDALGITILDERVDEVPNVPGRVYQLGVGARQPGEPITNLGARIDKGASGAIQASEIIRQGFRSNIEDTIMSGAPQAETLINKTDRTATAVRARQGSVNAVTAPPLELYAAHRAHVVEQAIELKRKFGFRPEQYGKPGDIAWKWFDPMQIPEDLYFVPAEGSWQPSTTETKREDVGLGLQWGVGTGQNPVMEGEAAKVLGFDIAGDDYDDWAIMGEKRLDALKEALPLVMQDAQAQMEQVPPEQMDQAGMMMEQGMPMELIRRANVGPQLMDKHEAFVRFYENDVYLQRQDEFATYPDVLKQAIQTLWQMHQQAGTMKAAQDTAQQVEAMRPAKEAEDQSGKEDAARTAQGEDAAREHESATRDEDHARSMEAQDVKHEQAMEMEREKQKGQKQLEEIRAKNRPKPGKR